MCTFMYMSTQSQRVHALHIWSYVSIKVSLSLQFLTSYKRKEIVFYLYSFFFLFYSHLSFSTSLL